MALDLHNNLSVGVSGERGECLGKAKEDILGVGVGGWFTKTDMHSSSS